MTQLLPVTIRAWRAGQRQARLVADAILVTLPEERRRAILAKLAAAKAVANRKAKEGNHVPD